jgi:hypothetical protein
MTGAYPAQFSTTSATKKPFSERKDFQGKLPYVVLLLQ